MIVLPTGLVTGRYTHRGVGGNGSVRIRTTAPIFRVGTSERELYREGITIRLEDGEITPTEILANDAASEHLIQPWPFQLIADYYIEHLPLPSKVFDLAAGQTVDLFDLVGLAIAPPVEQVVTAETRARAEAAALRSESAAIAAEAAAAGSVGAGGYSLDVPASAEWSIPHLFGRPPAVTVIVDGREVTADVSYPDPVALVLVTWPYPVAGRIILT